MKHYHVWSCSSEGQEYANTRYDDKHEASLKYMGLLANVFYRTPVRGIIDISVVLDEIDNHDGMVVSSDALNLVLSTCEHDCHSPIWN